MKVYQVSCPSRDIWSQSPKKDSLRLFITNNMLIFGALRTWFLVAPFAGYSYMFWANIQFGVLGDETSQILRRPIAPIAQLKIWSQTSNNCDYDSAPMSILCYSFSSNAHSAGQSHNIFASTFSVPHHGIGVYFDSRFCVVTLLLGLKKLEITLAH